MKKSKKKKSKKNKTSAQKDKIEDSNDVDKYFDNPNFICWMEMTPEFNAKLIATHPMKHEILAVYDKNEIQVIWLNKEEMNFIQKFLVFDNNKQEIKSIIFSKDSLLYVLNANGQINIYNYEIEEKFRGSFHPYEDNEDISNSPSNSNSKANLLATTIFSPMVEIDHETGEKFREFKHKRHLVTQGTLITSRNKNSEFTIWDINPLLMK